MPTFVPTHSIVPCLSLPSRQAKGGTWSCSKWLSQGHAVSWEGQAGGGQDRSCAAPLTTLGEHRVRRPEPPTKSPAALRSPILSS